MGMSILKAIEADRKPPARVVPADTQQVCVDLPGEEIRCYVYKPKLEILLRKHRDVVFDIQVFKGMRYTVEADSSDFYNARDKKIVLRSRKQTVSFVDGEQLHLHVGREFKGHLLLKANGKVLGRYDPNALDGTRCDADPATKAAPLLVVMKNDPAAKVPSSSAAGKPVKSSAYDIVSVGLQPTSPTEFAAMTKAAAEPQSMHVVEVKPELGVTPEEVADFFKHGGEDTAVDSQKLATRNWLWAQIAGGAAYVGDNNHWVRDLWKQKFYLTRAKGRTYIVFKGLPALRSYLTGTRYLTDTPKVLAISAGVGSIKGIHKAGWEAVKGSVKGAAKFAVILTITLDVAEWLADYEDRDAKTGKPKRDFYDLGAKIFTDVAWAALGAAAATLLMGLAVGFGLVAGGAVLVIGSIAAAIIIGYGLALIDQKIGITPALAASARAAGEYLDRKLPKDYSDFAGSIDAMMLGGAP